MMNNYTYICVYIHIVAKALKSSVINEEFHRKSFKFLL